jgi:hypothetical protein
MFYLSNHPAAAADLAWSRIESDSKCFAVGSRMVVSLYLLLILSFQIQLICYHLSFVPLTSGISFHDSF